MHAVSRLLGTAVAAGGPSAVADTLVTEARRFFRVSRTLLLSVAELEGRLEVAAMSPAGDSPDDFVPLTEAAPAAQLLRSREPALHMSGDEAERLMRRLGGRRRHADRSCCCPCACASRCVTCSCWPTPTSATSTPRRSRWRAPSPMPPRPALRSSSWPPTTPPRPPARPRWHARRARSTRASSSTACSCGSARRRPASSAPTTPTSSWATPARGCASRPPPACRPR